MKHQICINRDYGWFTGGFDNNQKHKHYAIQLSIPLESHVIIKASETTIESEQPVLIKSNVAHQILSDTPQFLLLINPASAIGHFWSHLCEGEIQEVSFTPASDLKNLLSDKSWQPQLAPPLNAIIEAYDCFCSTAIHQGDERVNQALAYLSNHFERVVPLDEVAAHVHLSSSRFLHLFKAQTGITYRRAQLWNKLVKGLTQFGKKSFTEIAHQNGFADSAHLSRVFKEHFGFSPRAFLKISQFVQV